LFSLSEFLLSLEFFICHIFSVTKYFFILSNSSNQLSSTHFSQSLIFFGLTLFSLIVISQIIALIAVRIFPSASR